MSALSSSVAIPRRGQMASGSISMPPTRNTSAATLSGSYIGSVLGAGAASLMRDRRSSLTPPTIVSAETEKKLSRTRRMSEQHRLAGGARPTSPRARIPTEKGDLTKEWARLMVNQFMLKHDRPLIKRSDTIVDISVTNCKSSVGEFSCTYQIDILLDRGREMPSPESSSNSLGGGGDSDGLMADGGNSYACIEGEDDDHDRFSLIAKLLPADDANRAYVFEANLLEKEIEMYFEVLPSICSFLATQPSGNLMRVMERVIPECVYGSHNSDGAGILVFRSVRDWGFQHCDSPSEGLSSSELELVVASLAAMHATGVAMITKNTPEKVKNRYPYLMQDMYESNVFLDEVLQHLQIYHELLRAGPEEETLESREVFSRLKARLEGDERGGGWTLLKGLRRQGPKTLNTLIHGEMWSQNIMFRPSDSRVLFLDWKNAKIASGTLDLAFLLFSSCTADLIANSLPRILRLYRDSLVATLQRLEPRCEEPTLREVEEDFLLSLPDALLQAVCMFVREMQFMEMSSVDGEGRVVEETARRLRVYERMAMNLLRIIEVEPRRTPRGDAVDGEEEPALRLRVKMREGELRRDSLDDDDDAGERGAGGTAAFAIGDEDEEEEE